MAVETTELQEGYRPSENEPYMSPKQIEYFRRKLIAWRSQLALELNNLLGEMKDDNLDVPGDNADRAYIEFEAGVELGTEDRYRELLYGIDEALQRIREGGYGYCEETGDEIGIKRLEAWPIATLSIEAQKKQERLERQQRGLI
jgi:DnaK suppressor protein